jgi:hypothetical protein
VLGFFFGVSFPVVRSQGVGARLYFPGEEVEALVFGVVFGGEVAIEGREGGEAGVGVAEEGGKGEAGGVDELGFAVGNPQGGEGAKVECSLGRVGGSDGKGAFTRAALGELVELEGAFFGRSDGEGGEAFEGSTEVLGRGAAVGAKEAKAQGEGVADCELGAAR